MLKYIGNNKQLENLGFRKTRYTKEDHTFAKWVDWWWTPDWNEPDDYTAITIHDGDKIYILIENDEDAILDKLYDLIKLGIVTKN